MTKHARLTSIALLASLALLGCERNTSNANANAAPGEQLDQATLELRREVLQNIGANIILPTYEDFAAKVDALEVATKAWADSGEASDREAAQQAWREAMFAWQRAEVFQIGPAGVMGQVAGGEDLRDQIYSWPLVNDCRVDQELVSQDYQDAEAFGAELINVRGLDAMEYLLFRQDDQNACAPNSSINSSGEWAALDAAELDRRRAAYAHTLARDVSGHADDLVQRWSPDGGDFVAALATAGDGSQVYATTQEALNALSDAMFYIEKETKDMKLADPTGFGDCDSDCLDERESRWANASREMALENLRAFEMLYLGTSPSGEDGPGFAELLEQAGAADVDADMRGRITAAITALEGIEQPMVDALTDDPDAVDDAYQKSKTLSDLLKTQFVGVLDLELPQRAEGDND